jgi:ribosomal protein L14E/L6E/L27E
MDYNLQCGSVVLSTKGRDGGNFFMILSVDKDIAYIADGNKHRLAAPKKKNIKHLKPNGEVLTAIAEKFKSNKKVFDSELKSALRQFSNNQTKGENNV